MTTFNPDWISLYYDTVIDILEERNLSTQQAAEICGMSATEFQGMLDGNIPMDGSLAEKLSRLGSTQGFWLRRGGCNYV